MDTLEQDLIIQFIKLDLSTKQRLLALVGDEFAKLDFEEWQREAKALQNELLSKYGENHFMPVEDMVREIREERDNELLGRSRL